MTKFPKTIRKALEDAMSAAKLENCPLAQEQQEAVREYLETTVCAPLREVLAYGEGIPRPDMLSPKVLAVYRLREEGQTFKEIGQALGFTTARASQHYKTAMRFIKRHGSENAVVPKSHPFTQHRRLG